jgi:hypothetical protein
MKSVVVAISDSREAFPETFAPRWSKMGELIVTKKKTFTHGSVSLVAVLL